MCYYVLFSFIVYRDLSMWRIMVLSEETHTCTREPANSTGSEQSRNQTPNLCANLQTWTASLYFYRCVCACVRNQNVWGVQTPLRAVGKF